MAPKGTKKSDSRVPQTIVETLEAPRLNGISTEDFVSFMQKREIYERRVTEKSQEQGIAIPATSYLNSIEKPILDIFVTAQWVPVSKTEEITEEHLRDCVQQRAVIKPEDYDLAQIDTGIADIKMDKSLKSLEMQVWNLGLQYSKKLEDLGYSTFITAQPNLAIVHILQRIKHPQLRKRMKLTYQLRKEELKKNYGLFLRETAKEAASLDRHDAANSFGEPSVDSDTDMGGSFSTNPPSNRHRKHRQGKEKGKGSKKKDGKSEKDANPPTPSRKRDKPDCLNPKCDKKHFLNECEITSREEKKKLLSAYYEAKKRKGSGGHVGQLASDSDILDHSSLFSASFCNGAVETTVLADQGSDACILPPSTLHKLQRANPNLKVVTLDRTVYYETVDKSATSLPCSRKIKASILLRIRHGTNLSLRNVEWLISDKPVGRAIISRHVLRALGLDNRVLLAAASDRFKGAVDVPDILEAQDNIDTAQGGSIHSLLEQHSFEFGSTFHHQRGTEEDSLEDSDIYIDLGEDSPDKLKACLAERVHEARTNGMSDDGCKQLSNLLDKYESVFEFGWENPLQPTLNQ